MHGAHLSSLSFSPDGTRLVAASEDYLVQVWSVSTGTKIGGPLQHTAQVIAASFSPDGELQRTVGPLHQLEARSVGRAEGAKNTIAAGSGAQIPGVEPTGNGERFDRPIRLAQVDAPSALAFANHAKVDRRDIVQRRPGTGRNIGRGGGEPV